jgi:hypothetical protein
MKSIKRDAHGVADKFMDFMDELETRTEIEFEKRIKMFSQLAKGMCEVTRLNMGHKQMALRAPDIAKNPNIVLQLGSKPIEGNSTRVDE